MSVLRLACASGPAYAAHTAAMLHSVIEHRGDLELRAHYLVGPGFPSRTARRIAEMVERHGASIEFRVIPEDRVSGLPAARSFDRAVWYRLLLAELLEDADRVLYLDGDVIAMDDLRPLWQADLAGSYAAAVPNVWDPWNAGRPAQLGLAGPHEYLNSGVVLLDLDRLRADDMSARLIDYARRNADRLPFLDQDVLSIVFAGRWTRLHPRWNCMNSVLLSDAADELLGAEAVAQARRSPGIRHFEGPSVNKPWHILCEREHRAEYFRHRRATPWPRVRPEGVTPANLLRLVGRGRHG